MSWAGSDRKQRLPDNWGALRRVVLAAASNRCETILPSGTRCPRAATDVDHRVPGDDHSLRNLQALCSHHHGIKSSREGLAARRVPKAARPPEAHPGTLSSRATQRRKP